jgi:phage N-6-adenine-methyltransferase
VSAVAKLAPLMSSTKMDWQTPDVVLDLVRRVGPIMLDPCTTVDNPVGAKGWYHLPGLDGLALAWPAFSGSFDGVGLIYVNPPYGRSLPAWIKKCAEAASNGAEIIALVPARTDTRWFRQVAWSSDAICFWYGRITFVAAPNAAPFPSAVVYWGERRKRFVEAFRNWGWIR